MFRLSQRSFVYCFLHADSADHRALTRPTPPTSPSTRRSVSRRLRSPPNASSMQVLTSPPTVESETAPSGMLGRGHYEAVSVFTDDDKNEYLKFKWSFDIKKDW